MKIDEFVKFANPRRGLEGHDLGYCIRCKTPLVTEGEGFVTEYCPKCKIIYYEGSS